jgi:hypothetical protein
VVKGVVQEKEAKDVKKRRAGSVTEKIHGWTSGVGVEQKRIAGRSRRNARI